ncbi:MAG TPA: glycosyltransferase, partial [Dermatophilaceae bacterium]
MATITPSPRTNDGSAYVGAQLLVRLHGQPIGEVQLPLRYGIVQADHLARALTAELSEEVQGHLAADGRSFYPPVTPSGADPQGGPRPCTWSARLAGLGVGRPFVSVVLATCRRPKRLTRTLHTLAAQTYPEMEVLVVDNCPSVPGAQAAIDAVQDSRIRRLEEPVPGASRARNAGLRAACGEVVAFTDDDVDVDVDWLGNLVTPFYEDPGTACVTGLILPTSLETPAERTIEEFGGFSKGFVPRTFAITDTGHGPMYPYNAGLFGSGACAAFRRRPFLALGGFSADLGPATVARGGEDLDAYLSVLYAGHRLRYAPAAVVRHEHRRDPNQLAKQVYGYGIGLSA